MLPESDRPRQIHTDGRSLPNDPLPSWMGYSVGKWEGDTLVVETNGLNEQAWLDASGHPRSEFMRITERYRRRDFGHMDLEITFDDPKYYTRPFSIKAGLFLVPDSELLEYVCGENVKVRAWTCGEDDMDYCLELSGASRGVKRYHSQDGWEIGAVRSPQELLDRVASRLPHAK